MKNKISLICTLGTSTPVVTEAIVALKKYKNINVNRLFIIHTDTDKLYNRNPAIEHDLTLPGLKKFLKKEYPGMYVKTISPGIDDIISEQDNVLLLKIILQVMNDEKKKSNTLLISIAGGRKTMSSLALFASYLCGCSGIYHILTKEDEFKLSKEKGFKIPPEKLNLIELPVIDLSPLFVSVINEIDYANNFNGDIFKYFSANNDLNELFKITNDELGRLHNIRALKSEYEKYTNTYSHMCSVTELILNAKVKQDMIDARIESRVKSFESFWEKILRKNYISPFIQTEDFSGVRIICYFQEDVEKLKEYFENENNDFKIAETISKIPGSFGYTAYHFIVTLSLKRLRLHENNDLKNVKCEIQLKTIFDHVWSRVEHKFRYKSEDYQKFSASEKKAVDQVFEKANVNLESAKKTFAALKTIYNK
jgi:CRISPR-associated Csx14 family protein